MSINSNEAEEGLSDLYFERKDGQWKTVANCLTKLISGKVVTLPELCAVGLKLAEDNSSSYNKIIKSAQKLNNRIGQAGRKEAQQLAYVSLDLAMQKIGHEELAAHFSRIAFNRTQKKKTVTLINRAFEKTTHAIKVLNKNRPKPPIINEPVTKEEILAAFISRDKYLHEELWHRDKTQALVLACVTAQANPWKVVSTILGPHSLPYPYEYELISAQACFSALSIDGRIELSSLPALPDNLISDDTNNCPLLSSISITQKTNLMPNHADNTNISLAEFSQQLLLEILYHRLGTK